MGDVRGHVAHGFCEFLSQHERVEIDLSQCPFADDRVAPHALIFLIICPKIKGIKTGQDPTRGKEDLHEMFDACGNAFTLKTVDVGRCHYSR